MGRILFLCVCLILLACGGPERASDFRGADVTVWPAPAGQPVTVPFADPRADPFAELEAGNEAVAATVAATTPFGRLSRALSEPGGYFPSDNLVSNEVSYQHIVPALSELGVVGGAYIGVGPEQNFTYIAHIRPEVAFIIDIRRGNLLQHLLYKAVFENARNRLEYLALMSSRPVPADLESWDDAVIDEIVLYIDTVAAPIEGFEEADTRLLAAVTGYGYPLTDRDLGTIRNIHFAFWAAGQSLRYSNDGRGRSSRFPTWRQMTLQTDLGGVRRSFLASEESFRRIKRMQREHRIVPVVGDLGGSHALAAVGREIAKRELTVSAFYVSNVEQYLFRGPGFDRFASTVAALPIDERSVFIRSYFARRVPIAQTVPGHFSTQLLERIGDFVATEQAGGYLDYMDLVTRNTIQTERGEGGGGGGGEEGVREGEGL